MILRWWNLTLLPWQTMMRWQRGVPFATQFRCGDPVLDKIDSKILKRRHHRAVPGTWYSGKKRWWMDPCSQWDTANIVRPGSQADEFGRLIIEKLLDEWKSKSSPCKQWVWKFHEGSQITFIGVCLVNEFWKFQIPMRKYHLEILHRWFYRWWFFFF